MDFKDKKIAVLGAGVEGKSADAFLKSQGAVVSVFDEKKASFPDLSSFDLIVRSPGVKLSHKRLDELRSMNYESRITSATKLFFDLCPTKNIIGITGTKGKGTTSTLIYEILKAAGKDVHLCGNIGTPMLNVLPKLKESSFVVLELSSFQLIDLHKSPHIAVVLMATSDHLDWHKDHGEYLGAKTNIVKHQEEFDFIVVNEDYENSVKIAEQSKGKKVGFSLSRPPFPTGAVRIGIPGKHNLENVYAAYCVGKILDIPDTVMFGAIQNFKGLPHRLEFVKKVGGAKYYNDSFSSNPSATIAALSSFSENKIMIIGGIDRGVALYNLAEHINRSAPSIRKVLLIGQIADKVKKLLEDVGFHEYEVLSVKTMKEIIDHARELAQPDDVVILSPGFASFDMFKNFEERGNQFKQEVNAL